MPDHHTMSLRHHTERPLKSLVDDELGALIEIGRHTNMMTTGLADALDALAELAHRELDEREFKEALNA